MPQSQRVKDLFSDSVQVLSEAGPLLADDIAAAGNQIADALLNESKILACGNGGSAACVQYFTAMMLNRFDMERPGLPAIALTPDSTTLTAIASDYQFADVYAKQIRALARPGDILLTASCDGKSHSIVHALDAAHDRGVHVVALTGQDGGRITDLLQETDIEIRAPSWINARIQEIHITVIHAISDLIDRRLLGQED